MPGSSPAQEPGNEATTSLKNVAANLLNFAVSSFNHPIKFPAKHSSYTALFFHSHIIVSTYKVQLSAVKYSSPTMWPRKSTCIHV